MMAKKLSACILSFFLIGVSVLAWQTIRGIQDVPETLSRVTGPPIRFELLDRNGKVLTTTYQNSWNIHDQKALHQIPQLLQTVFIQSEDKRFFQHSGVDWAARIHALWQNSRALRKIRGASTITEQVVRMIHPRKRTVWSRWLEGFEAAQMEQHYSKSEILEFYLNQVPFASNRRGVVQAARYYFDRDIDTLTLREMICLAVLVRAPSRLDLHKNPENINQAVARMTKLLERNKILATEELQRTGSGTISICEPALAINADHFIQYVRSSSRDLNITSKKLKTTLDAGIQLAAQDSLDTWIAQLKNHNVNNGALVVVDHHTNEILAWAVARPRNSKDFGHQINAVLALRQPGSAMKPFLYTQALEKGWTAATLINDAPLSEPVGTGLHTYHNYSRQHYGPIPLRQALGNSLNIPAIKTIEFVGINQYLSCLKQLGFSNLSRHPDFYGPGLALGNAEVSLLEIVQAYTVLSRYGSYLPLTAIHEDFKERRAKRIFSTETTSIIANILSDPAARFLEFGSNSVLNFPVQTAVKTGTSSNYRDAWALGYNYRYTAGVWMGNLDARPMDGITGSKGPAQVLRDLFSRLNRFKQTRPLYMSPLLEHKTVCINDTTPCIPRTEWFVKGTACPDGPQDAKVAVPLKPYHPENGLIIAMDPRIPDEKEAFTFQIRGLSSGCRVQWIIDNVPGVYTAEEKLIWPLSRGHHRLKARIEKKGTFAVNTSEIHFWVQ